MDGQVRRSLPSSQLRDSHQDKAEGKRERVMSTEGHTPGSFYQTLSVKLQPGLGVGERLVFLHYLVDGETRDCRERHCEDYSAQPTAVICVLRQSHVYTAMSQHTSIKTL